MSLPVLFVSLWRSHNLGDRPDLGCKFTERAWRCDSPHHLSLRAGSYKSLFIASVILSTLIPASQSQYLLEKKTTFRYHHVISRIPARGIGRGELKTEFCSLHRLMVQTSELVQCEDAGRQLLNRFQIVWRLPELFLRENTKVVI